LTFTEPQSFDLLAAHASTADLTLGEDAVLGSAFKDDLPALDIVIKGITLNDLNDYLEAGKTRRLITELLCSYFLPLDLSYNLKIKVTESTLGFDLDNAVLGINSMLN
jgi:predicted component of type VI protein secretion system